jgi:hypothetical protein
MTISMLGCQQQFTLWTHAIPKLHSFKIRPSKQIIYFEVSFTYAVFMTSWRPLLRRSLNSYRLSTRSIFIHEEAEKVEHKYNSKNNLLTSILASPAGYQALIHDMKKSQEVHVHSFSTGKNQICQFL